MSNMIKCDRCKKLEEAHMAQNYILKIHAPNSNSDPCVAHICIQCWPDFCGEIWPQTDKKADSTKNAVSPKEVL